MVDNMVMFYFSGTGNSKYIAEQVCRQTHGECHSIEENIDFGRLMASQEIIGFCYPIYGSRVPRIMREFVIAHKGFLENKKVIILCTQLIFSGDGARVFTDLFPRGFFEVIYAEHFLMPNNVCNFFLLPVQNERKIAQYKRRADRKIQSVCADITAGKNKKRGFNVMSRLLGLTQGAFVPIIEKRAMGSVKICGDCTLCLLCVSLCPMKNLKLKDDRIVHNNNCISCYRCVNQCPQIAITVFCRGKVKKQYRGISM